MLDSFKSLGTFEVGGRQYRIVRLQALERKGFRIARLPYCIRIVLENLLRHEDGEHVRAADIEAVAGWEPRGERQREIAYMPARVLLQDFTGVPAVVDLAAMRDAIVELGGDASRINPRQPAELVIDHSVQVDTFGAPESLRQNVELEFKRNRERYAFLRWGQQAFQNLLIVPPATGIIHQVNLEYLARVVMTADGSDGLPWAFPDTLIGTDSHTTMINGLGVLGWGVGGIEAEAAMLGQPLSMLVPQVIGVRLSGRIPDGATATDAVLMITELLRRHGVVGKFIEFFGPGLRSLPLADRATISNMCPEYGATCAIFPVDAATLEYLRLTGRPAERLELIESYLREQGFFQTGSDPEAEYSEVLDFDLSKVEPSLAGPRRPQDRIRLAQVASAFRESLSDIAAPAATATGERAEVELEIDGQRCRIGHGSVVLASITSCTNTSNPSVMLAAGLLAKKAVERGLRRRPWVKTSLAPGSRVVTEYLRGSGLLPYLEQLGFHVVGYGCATCIGNSGPLPEPVAKAVQEGNLVVAAVLSGNRNFEGRVHALVRANYLASPPLVVAYALAGRIDLELTSEPIGQGGGGNDVYLRDIWPSQAAVNELVGQVVQGELFQQVYGDVFRGGELWQALEVPAGETYRWDEASTYVRRPPFFDGLGLEPPPVEDIRGARALAVLGDSITTDHISPAGSIKPDSPAGKYLLERGVPVREFNTYGSRRGNHEVMMRGTFANVRLKNRLVPGVEGGFTVHLPAGEQMTIFDAAMKYQQEGVPLLVLAGKEYGSGSSRDWAAKGPRLLGVRAVIAESFERIHRSNLVGMGILPLQFAEGQSVESLGLTGRERFSIEGLAAAIESRFSGGRTVRVTATAEDGRRSEFEVTVRLDTPQEIEYYRHGGILQYVLRQLAAK